MTRILKAQVGKGIKGGKMLMNINIFHLEIEIV